MKLNFPPNRSTAVARADGYQYGPDENWQIDIGDIDHRIFIDQGCTVPVGERPTGRDDAHPFGFPSGPGFYDPALGKPIWWTGLIWIDALGNAV